MIGRTPAEVVKSLRELAEITDTRIHDRVLCASAADLIERLTAQNARLTQALCRHDATIVRVEAAQAALPDCPTCTNVPGHQLHPNPCQDCDGTGKVSPTQLAALWQAVHATGDEGKYGFAALGIDAGSYRDYLRAVRPT